MDVANAPANIPATKELLINNEYLCIEWYLKREFSDDAMRIDVNNN